MRNREGAHLLILVLLVLLVFVLRHLRHLLEKRSIGRASRDSRIFVRIGFEIVCVFFLQS